MKNINENNKMQYLLKGLNILLVLYILVYYVPRILSWYYYDLGYNRYFANTKYAEARQSFQKALFFNKIILFNYKIETAKLLARIAYTYEIEKKYPDACKYYDQAYYNYKLDKKLGNNNYSKYLLDSLSEMYLKLGDYKKAEEYGKNSLAITEKISNLDRIFLRYNLNHLGVIYQYQGKYDEAEKYYNEVINLSKNKKSKYTAIIVKADNVYDSINNLSILYIDRGNYQEAERIMSSLKGITKDKEGPLSYFYLYSYYKNLGILEHYKKDYIKSQKYYFKTIKTINAAYHYKTTEKDLYLMGLLKYHAKVIEKLIALSYVEQGKYKQAEELLNKVLMFKQQNLGLENPENACAFYDLGYLYSKNHNSIKSKIYYNKAMLIQANLLQLKNLKYDDSFNRIEDFCKISKIGVM